MDNSIISKHYEIAAKFYPTLNLTQLGMVLVMLGVIRSTLGHEGASGTITDYIHKDALAPDIKECIDFIECEIIGKRKSRIDIDYFKIGNSGEFRPL